MESLTFVALECYWSAFTKQNHYGPCHTNTSGNLPVYDLHALSKVAFLGHVLGIPMTELFASAVNRFLAGTAPHLREIKLTLLHAVFEVRRSCLSVLCLWTLLGTYIHHVNVG